MRKGPRPMREIHEIQERIYFEQKDMTVLFFHRESLTRSLAEI